MKLVELLIATILIRPPAGTPPTVARPPRRRRGRKIVKPASSLLDGCDYTPSWKMEPRSRYMNERLAGAYGPRSPDGIHRATIGADSEPEGDRFKEVGNGN